MADAKGKKKLGAGRHVSAMKRARQNEKRRARNRGVKANLRTAIKKLRGEPSAKTLNNVIPLLDKAVSKGVLPRRRASRLVSRLTLLVNRPGSSQKAASPK